MTRYSLIILITTFLYANSGAAGVNDPNVEYQNFSNQIRSILLAGDFDYLEELGDELRTKKSRFSDGRWKLTAFYKGMHPPHNTRDPDTWILFENKLNQWKQKTGSNSPTAHVALASFYLGKAWQARGTGYANTVNQEGWKNWYDNLGLAKTTLTMSAAISNRCPHWYNVMQKIALGEGWPEDAYEGLFEEAVTKEPSYYFYYFSKADFYQSRWYGNKDKLKNFVADAVKRTYSSEGNTLYARIYWSAQREFGRNMFQPGNVEWTKMKAGFEFMNNQHPNSIWNLNAYAHFACLAGDRDTTASILRKIDNKINVRAWWSFKEVEYCRQWSQAADA